MLNNLLEDLEFISSIPPNAKPNFYDKTYTLTNEWFSTIKRRYKSEKGEKGIIYIENLINNLEQIKSLEEHLKLLEKVVIGLNNIVCTYKTENQGEVARNYENSKNKLEILIKNANKSNFFNRLPNIIK